MSIFNPENVQKFNFAHVHYSKKTSKKYLKLLTESTKTLEEKLKLVEEGKEKDDIYY